MILYVDVANDEVNWTILHNHPPGSNHFFVVVVVINNGPYTKEMSKLNVCFKFLPIDGVAHADKQIILQICHLCFTNKFVSDKDFLWKNCQKNYSRIVGFLWKWKKKLIDEDGIRTHAGRAQWISSPSP